MPRFSLPSRPPQDGVIQAGGITARLQKLFRIQGKSPVTTLGDVLQPVVIAHDITTEGFEPQLAGRYAAGSDSQAPVVGQYPQIQIHNPIGSGTLLRVERVRISSDTLTRVGISLYGTSIGVLSASARTVLADLRDGVPLNPVGAIRTLSGAVAPPLGNVMAETYLLAATPLLMEVSGVVLGPGAGLIAYGLNTNITLYAAFAWRERSVVS